jgi:hypothetical protein
MSGISLGIWTIFTSTRSNTGWCKSQGSGLIQPLDSVFVRGWLYEAGWGDAISFEESYWKGLE